MKEELDDNMIQAIVSYRIERSKDTIQEAIDLLEKDHFMQRLIGYIMPVITQSQHF